MEAKQGLIFNEKDLIKLFFEIMLGFFIFLGMGIYGVYIVIKIYEKRFTLGILRYCFHKVGPILSISIFYFYKNYFMDRKNLKNFKYISVIILSVIGLILVFALYYQVRGFESRTVLGIDWKYITLYEYIIAYFFMFLHFFHKTKKWFPSSIFGILAISFGGWIYEIPITLANSALTNLGPLIIEGEFNGVFIHSSFPLFISTPLLSGLFIYYILKNWNWKPTYFIWVFFGLFSIFSICYFFDYYLKIRYIPGWIPRLPSLILMGSLPSGLKKSK